MINLYERKSEKLPCITSLFLNTWEIPSSAYTSLKQIQSTIYNKEDKTIEIPPTGLYSAVKILIKYDSVNFNRYREVNQEPSLISLKEFKFKCTPFKHQYEGIEYGLSKNKWLLLDSMGLGKTLQMVYLAEVLKIQGKIDKCLVICGRNNLQYTWLNEIKTASIFDGVVLGDTVTKRGKVKSGKVSERCDTLKNPINETFVITNLATLQSDEFVNAFKKSKNKFDMIVFDELHKCKNPNTDAGKHLLKLNATYQVGLTGTPIMNTPNDAYLILKWIGRIRCNFSEFKSFYNVYGGFNNVQIVGKRNLDILSELFNSCSLRRLKEDVLDLPSKTYQTEYVDLTDKERVLYDNIADVIVKEATEKGLSTENIDIEIALNTRKRQVTACPWIFGDSSIQSSKVLRAYEFIHDIIEQGDKVLVFCTYTETVERMFEELRDYGVVACTGHTPDYQVEINKGVFANNSDCKIMLATWEQMAEGHTLVSANYIIFIDTPWNDAVFQQCCDRIYRIGQVKNCTIITIVARDTYDERVYELVQNKRQVSEYTIDNVENGLIQEDGLV